MSKTTPFTVALVQMAMTDAPDENRRRACEFVAQAARDGADLVILPELFASRYFCQVEDAALFDLAETIPGPSTQQLGPLADEYGVEIVASLFEKRSAGVYHNTAVLIDAAGQVVDRYRKMHIPDDPAYYEKFYFTPGDLGFRTVRTRHASIGTLVCWDQWYPEAARLTAMRGAELLVYPTAIGWHPAERDRLGHRQREAWQTIQRSHAVANGVFVASVNRVGHEPHPTGQGEGIVFWGSSFLAGPFGEILAEAPADKEAVILAEVDPSQIETTRRGWPFLRDRRIDAYDGLTRRLLDDVDG